MANGFGSAGRRRQQPRRAKFGGGRSNSLEDTVGMLVLRDLIKQQGEQRAAARKPAEDLGREGAKIVGQTQKQNVESRSAFNQLTSMLSGIVGQVKGAKEEQGGLGIIPGIKGAIGSRIPDELSGATINIGSKSFTPIPEGFDEDSFSRREAAFGQRVETAARLNKILTGQNRVIKSMINMIMRSLPGAFDSESKVSTKLSQTLLNAFKVTKAVERAGLTLDDLNQMTDADLDAGGFNIDLGFELSPEEIDEFNQIEAQVAGTPTFEERNFFGSAQGLDTQTATAQDSGQNALEAKKQRLRQRFELGV